MITFLSFYWSLMNSNPGCFVLRLLDKGGTKLMNCYTNCLNRRDKACKLGYVSNKTRCEKVLQRRIKKLVSDSGVF